jgi:hypothetical protein
MNKIIATLTTSGAMLAASVLPALAYRPRVGGRHQAHQVPEIDASAGLLAVAAVLAIMVFVWERNRRTA